MNISLTVKEACDMWLDRNKLKSSTYSTYSYKLNSQIIPKLGHYKLTEVTQDIINDYINNLISNGRLNGSGGLAPKTVVSIVMILKQVLDEHNLTFKYKVPTIKRKEVKIFQKIDYQRFINYLFFDTTLEKLGLLITLFCGIRIGELSGLKWKYIDTDTGIIKIKYTLQRIKNPDPTAKNKTIIILDTPKSDTSIRNIPIQDFILDLLKQYKTCDDYFFLTGSRKYVEPRTLENRFEKHLERCGIKNINFHATRHTFASRCVELGIDIKTISEVLGHSDVKFTMNTYVHVSMEHKKSQLEKLSTNM